MPPADPRPGTPRAAWPACRPVRGYGPARRPSPPALPAVSVAVADPPGPVLARGTDRSDCRDRWAAPAGAARGVVPAPADLDREAATTRLHPVGSGAPAASGAGRTPGT